MPLKKIKSGTWFCRTKPPIWVCVLWVANGLPWDPWSSLNFPGCYRHLASAEPRSRSHFPRVRTKNLHLPQIYHPPSLHELRDLSDWYYPGITKYEIGYRSLKGWWSGSFTTKLSRNEPQHQLIPTKYSGLRNDRYTSNEYHVRVEAPSLLGMRCVPVQVSLWGLILARQSFEPLSQ